MKIILCRHGLPCPENSPSALFLNSQQLAQWVDHYNASAVSREHQPSEKTLETLQRCRLLVASDLHRSIDSCQLLDKDINHVDVLFREAGFPVPQNNFLSLPLGVWLMSLRLLWVLGYSVNSESYKEAKSRATEASKKLQHMAIKHDSVGLMGHGIMNRLIASNLIAAGWRKTESAQERTYWGFSVFEKQ